MGSGSGDGRGAGPAGSRPRYGNNKRLKTGGGRRWCAAAEETFFERLAALRNVRAAAEAAGFSAGTVYALRRARPQFAERWRAALEVPRDLASNVPERAKSIVRYTREGRAKRVRCHTQWSEETEALFLDVLAATCNVGLQPRRRGSALAASIVSAGCAPTSRSDGRRRWSRAMRGWRWASSRRRTIRLRAWSSMPSGRSPR